MDTPDRFDTLIAALYDAVREPAEWTRTLAASPTDPLSKGWVDRASNILSFGKAATIGRINTHAETAGLR
jgi:hypothetical protein